MQLSSVAAPSDSVATDIAQDSALSALCLLMRIRGQAVDPEQLRHQFGSVYQPIDEVHFLRAIGKLGLRGRKISRKWDRLQRTPLPAIAIMGDGRYRVLAAVRHQEGREAVLLADAENERPEAVSRQEFEEEWSGKLILVASRGDLVGAQRRFDLSWFIPAIVKYRRMFGEVLFASFVIQLLALISPLIWLRHRSRRTAFSEVMTAATQVHPVRE